MKPHSRHCKSKGATSIIAILLLAMFATTEVDSSTQFKANTRLGPPPRTYEEF